MSAGEPLSQLLRLLELVKAMPCTRLDVFNHLGILNCAQRISDLRKLGHPIDTTYTHQTDEQGRAHRVAQYVWNPQQKRQVELWQ